MEATFRSVVRLRKVRARKSQRHVRFRIDRPHPTLLDWRFCGDAWIVRRDDEMLSLCLGNYPLAVIRGLSLDLPSLNQLLDRIRHSYPRRRTRA